MSPEATPIPTAAPAPAPALDEVRGLLEQLEATLAEETALLDADDADGLVRLVEHKDTLCQRLARHPALAPEQQAALTPLEALLRSCQQRNQDNGARIAARRAQVRDRMQQLDGSGTYGANGALQGRRPASLSHRA